MNKKPITLEDSLAFLPIKPKFQGKRKGVKNDVPQIQSGRGKKGTKAP